MEQEINIRDASVDDAPVIAEIYNQTILAATATMDSEPKTTADIIEQMREFCRREGYLVMERDGQVVGWGVIKLYSPRAGYSRCAETSVYFDRAETRKGYGTVMKRALIERCREYGYHHLLGRVWASNTASIEYNRRLGYEVVGIQREIGFAGGKWRDVAILQLVLDDVGPEVAEKYL